LFSDVQSLFAVICAFMPAGEGQTEASGGYHPFYSSTAGHAGQTEYNQKAHPIVGVRFPPHYPISPGYPMPQSKGETGWLQAACGRWLVRCNPQL